MKGVFKYSTKTYYIFNPMESLALPKRKSAEIQLLNKAVEFTADILLTRRYTNEVKSNLDIYRFLGTNSTFDFLPKDSKDTYSLNFRIIRIKISESKYETIVTNL